jgi:hypothetical protein
MLTVGNKTQKTQKFNKINVHVFLSFHDPMNRGATEDENSNPFVVSPPEAETTPFDRLRANGILG